MTISEDDKLIKRAEELSNAVPFVEFFQDLADTTQVWMEKGLSEQELDERVLEGVRELGWDAEVMAKEIPQLEIIPEEKRAEFLRLLKIETWAVECVKSIAKDEKPIPFIYGVGDVIVDVWTFGPDEPLVWACATAATPPEALAKKLLKTCRETFGRQASKDPKPRVKRKGQKTPAEATAAHRQGMSYAEIAVQNLRGTHPDIIASPGRFKKQIETERMRLRDEIHSFEKLWEKRLPEPPTEE